MPFAPGAPPDIYACMVATTLSDVLGQQVIVENRAGAAMLPIYPRGAGSGMADVIAGHIPIIFLGLGASAPQVQSRELRALAVTGRQRPANFPDVPTFREGCIDLGEIEDGAWFGIVAPKGTPAPIIEKLNRAVNQEAAGATVKTRFGFPETPAVC